MPVILDGKETQKKICEELSVEIENLKEKGITPGLGIVQVGNRKDSTTYISWTFN